MPHSVNTWKIATNVVLWCSVHQVLSYASSFCLITPVLNKIGVFKHLYSWDNLQCRHLHVMMLDVLHIMLPLMWQHVRYLWNHSIFDDHYDIWQTFNDIKWLIDCTDFDNAVVCFSVCITLVQLELTWKQMRLTQVGWNKNRSWYEMKWHEMRSERTNGYDMGNLHKIVFTIKINI